MKFLPLILALFATTAVAAEPAPKPLHGLLVTGGCCHDFKNQKRILSEGLSARLNVEWTIVQEDAPKGTNEKIHRVSIYEKPEWWKRFDVVLHNECFGAVEDVAFVEGIAAGHKAGVPAVMLHCSVHSYRAAKTDEWRQAVGITSMSHDKNRDLTVKVVNAEHPVMKGFPAEWLNPKDELYRNEKLWPNTVPLANAFSEESKKDHVVVWVNTYGAGKVFATSLGHNNATMESPVYLDLVARGLLWACDKLNTDGTPKAGFGPVVK